MLDFTPYDHELRLFENEINSLHSYCETDSYDPLESVEVILLRLNQYLDKECVKKGCIDALAIAARQGHLNVVNRLLQIDAVRDATAASNLALWEAARNGHLHVVNSLLEIPAIRNNATMNSNAALCAAAMKGHHDVVTRLLQEENVADYLKQRQQNFIHEPQEYYNEFGTLFTKRLEDFFKKIEDRRVARILAAQSLSQTCGSEYITSHILALAYHNVLCGKSVCTKLAQNPEEGLITCPVINQFQNQALGAKARAQAKLGTQATTSSSATSSAEPAKKARIN